VDIGNWDGKVDRIVLKAARPVSKGKIIMKKLEPSEVWEVPQLSEKGWQLYRYLNIDTNINATSVTLYFSVERSWIEENSVESISLWKYDSGWKNIGTQKTGESGNKVNYSSNLTGFSYFAIAGKIVESTPESTTTIVEKENACGNGVCEPGETGICLQDCKIQEKGLETVWLAGILATIIAIMIILNKSRFKKKVKINQIYSSPEKYLGKKVLIECVLTPLQYLQDRGLTIYSIRDSTGEIRGISSYSGYEGEGTVEGMVRKSGNELYIEL